MNEETIKILINKLIILNEKTWQKVLATFSKSSLAPARFSK